MKTSDIWKQTFDSITINNVDAQMEVSEGDSRKCISVYSEEAFQILSKLWLTTGWGRKYSYGFSWMGRPIIQTPEDLLRYQETLFEIRPDIVIETGIAHGGSLIFVASMLELIGKGKVIGIDIEIRPHNRQAIEEHPLFHRITMHESSSSDPKMKALIEDEIKPGETVLVTLDSCHSTEHVLAELRLYSDLVTVGSFIIVADGLMPFVADAPGAKSDFADSNPLIAIEQFLEENNDFEMCEPPQLFNESNVSAAATYWPNGWLKRIR